MIIAAILCVTHCEPSSILNLFLQQSYEIVTVITPVFEIRQPKHREIAGLGPGHPGDKWQRESLDPELSDSKTSAVISLIPTTATPFSQATFVLPDDSQIWDTPTAGLFYLGDVHFRAHVEAFEHPCV